MLKASDQEIERAKKFKIEVEDDEAFLHCQSLLD
jgi:chromosome segregation ATPase